jgi:hypothetical protein
MFSATNGSPPSHERYPWASPNWVSTALSTPYSVLRISRHIAPLTMVGSAQGRITIDRNSHRNRSGAASSNASPMPKSSSAAVETTVKYSVCPAAVTTRRSESTSA